jgi:inorganic pyrophosphatase
MPDQNGHDDARARSAVRHLASMAFPARALPTHGHLAGRGGPVHRVGAGASTRSRPAGTVEPVKDASTTAVDVVIEIPTGSRNKYEYDHENHVIRLDRRLFTATAYPADYGFVPETLSKDGDPLDALVLVADPTFPGCVVRARILGVFFMRDEAGLDAKLLTVLEHDPQWDGANDIADLPQHLLNEIEHFFSIYKDLEPEKHTEVMGFADRSAALEELEACREAFAGHEAKS